MGKKDKRIRELEEEVEHLLRAYNGLRADLVAEMTGLRRPHEWQVASIYCPGCSASDFPQPHICGLANIGITPYTITTTGTGAVTLDGQEPVTYGGAGITGQVTAKAFIGSNFEVPRAD